MSGDRVRRAGLSALHKAGALVLLSLLAACATAPQQTATSDPRNGDGLGGTGVGTEVKSAAVNPRGDGIGGTGVVGTISGFGSIIVNGLELEFGHATNVASDGRPASLEELRIGQVVQGMAYRRDGKLHLDSVEIQHAVTGPITVIDYAAETMTVLGQKVRMNLGGDKNALDAFKTLQRGDAVSVSGLRLSDGTIVATRIDQQRDDGRVVVRGDATAVTATSLRIGELDVALASATILSQPKAGSRMFVSGRMINNQFSPDVISGGAAPMFGKDLADVSLEAYVPADAAKGGVLNIHGIPVSGATLPAGTAVNDRIVVTGRVGDDSKITATGIAKVRTVVTVLQARGTLRPAALRPEMNRPDRVRPPERTDRPQSVRPDIPKPERPQIERPQGNCC